MTQDLDPLDQEPAPPGMASEDLLSPVTSEQEGALKQAALMSLALAAFEAAAALMMGSIAVMAIAIDSLHDALTAGTTLLLAGRSQRLYRIAAVVVSVLIGLAFLWIVWIGLTGFGVNRVPNPWLMIAVALISLAVNLIAAWRLKTFASEDGDIRWVWRQTRWDFVADIAVIIAALAISDFGQRWPDLGAGLLIAAFNIWGIYKLVRAMWLAETAKIRSG